MGEIAWGTSNMQTAGGGGGGIFGFGGGGVAAPGSGLVALLEAVKDTTVGNEIAPAIDKLIAEFADSEQKFGNYIDGTDKRLNGLGAWSLASTPNVGTSYTWDTTGVAEYALTNKQVMQRELGEIIRRQNVQQACLDIMAGWFVDLRQKLMRTVIAQDSNGLPVLALTGGLTPATRKQATVVDPSA